MIDSTQLDGELSLLAEQYFKMSTWLAGRRINTFEAFVSLPQGQRSEIIRDWHRAIRYCTSKSNLPGIYTERVRVHWIRLFLN